MILPSKKSLLLEIKCLEISVLFFTFPCIYGSDLDDWIKNKVSNDRSYDNQWKEECKYYKNDWGVNRLIQPRFKRDSKKQRRIQCGITYKKFIKYFVETKIV